MIGESFSGREVSRLIADMSERHGSQDALARALGLPGSAISEAILSQRIQASVLAVLGLEFHADRGRYVRVRETAYIHGTQAHAAIVILQKELEAARSQVASLRYELARLRRRHGEAA